ncbi:hypothetical protein ANO11243_096000 [Dothideomycetidae sp. 11243]|nr:hypothetical protein ANO11243_096000 [fungal sp. No.11243]
MTVQEEKDVTAVADEHQSGLFTAQPRDDDAEKASNDGSTEHTEDTRSGKEELDQYPHGMKLILLAGASVVSVFLIALDQTIVGTAIPKITDEFHSLNDVSWYAAAYFMTFGAAQTSAGKMYKYYNIKWAFLLSMVVFEVGSLICAIARDSKTLIVGRAIAGLGGAGLSVGGASTNALVVPPPKRPLMLGIIGMTYCIAAVLGPLLGGVFTNELSWRWCFYINLPIGGVAAVVFFFYFQLPAAGAPPKLVWWRKLLHLDPAGIALAMGAITCFILAFQYGGISRPWGSSVVVGLFVGFALLIAVLVAWEIWLDEYAMMLPRLYKHRWLTAPAAYQFFFMGSYIVLLYHLPIYFQSVLGTTAIRSGVDNLPLVLAAGVAALTGGAVVMKTGRPQQVMFVGSMLATVGTGLIYTLDIGTPTVKWAGYQVFMGLTMAFAIMHGVVIAQAYVSIEDLPAATANLLYDAVFQTVGGAFSAAVSEAAFTNRLLAILPKSAPSVNAQMVLATGASELQNVFGPAELPGVLIAYMGGLKAAFAVAVGFCGAAFLCTLAIPMEKLPSHRSGEEPMAMA